VLQALYFCKPFRYCVNRYIPLKQEETLLTCLSELYKRVATQKKKNGILAPRKFIAKLRKDNELFKGFQQQDAHEFLNYLLNEIADTLIKEKKQKKGDGNTSENEGSKTVTPTGSSSNVGKETKTWIHEIFEGVLTNETKCLCCENVTSRDESFLDLSVDIEQNSSVTGCLRNFSSSETLCHKDKFFCDTCSSLQEAEKRMKIKKLPNVLALHLKRFKFIETTFKKLSYRVVFPLELRLFNTSLDSENPDRMYELIGVVIHIGSGPNQGHYISLIKSSNNWLVFDDETVEPVDEKAIQQFFGSSHELPISMESGYILFYQAKDMDLTAYENMATENMSSDADLINSNA
jgi:ubiquitin carboxyl-terminal hydrolase 12/46